MAKLERLEKRFEQQKREIALLEARKREQQDVLYLANRYNRNKDVIEDVETEIADLEAKISKRPSKSSNSLILGCLSGQRCYRFKIETAFFVIKAYFYC